MPALCFHGEGMPRTPRLLARALLASVTLAALVPHATAESSAAPLVSFRFAPPDGTDYVMTTTTVRERNLEGVQRQVDRIESETAVSIKRTAEGYLIASTPLSIRMTRDGQAVQDPVNTLLQGLPITYEVDRGGQIQEITGYDVFMEKMNETLPPEIAKALAPLINEAAMIAREKAEWQSRIGAFAGRDLAVGAPSDARSPYTLPNGESIEYTTRTTMRGLEPCAAGSCARIELSYSSDATALGKAIADTVAGLPGAAAAGAARASAAQVSGEASRLIDPQTMLFYEEKASRTMSMVMDFAGKGKVPTSMSETRSYSFSYH